MARWEKFQSISIRKLWSTLRMQKSTKWRTFLTNEAKQRPNNIVASENCSVMVLQNEHLSKIDYLLYFNFILFWTSCQKIKKESNETYFSMLYLIKVENKKKSVKTKFLKVDF